MYSSLVYLMAVMAIVLLVIMLWPILTRFAVELSKFLSNPTGYKPPQESPPDEGDKDG